MKSTSRHESGSAKPMAWAVLHVALITAGCGTKPGAGTETAGDDGQQVQLVAVETREFTRSIGVQGTWRAPDFAMVPARIGGTLVAVLAEDGTTVTNGQTLARIDAEKREYAVEVRRQDVSVARSALDVARAQAERAGVESERTANDHRRFTALRSDEAVSEQVSEQAEAQWKAAVAAEKVAIAQIALAEAQWHQAETALAIAERDLRDADIRAPLDGVVSARLAELGENVKAESAVFRIDGTNGLEFSAFITERHYPDIEPGTTRVRLHSTDRFLCELPVSYRAPTVNETFRTFEIRCVWRDPPDWMAPGMMAQAQIVLERRQGRGVPDSAVVRRAEGERLCIVTDGRARIVPVTTGFTTDGLTEIVDGLAPGVTHVVGAGQFALSDGDRVTVLSEESGHVSF